MIERLKRGLVVLAEKDYAPLLPVFFVIIVIITPWNKSLWLDETITYWLIKDGPIKLFSRVIEYQGQSPFYYMVLWCFSCLLGSSEAALRAPSLLFFLAAAGLLYSFAKRLCGRRTAAFTLLFFISIDEVRVAMLSARPYAFGLFWAFLSAYLFLRLMENEKKGALFGFVLSTAATFYAHYLFSVIVLVQILLALALRKQLRKDFLRDFLLALFAIGLICVPGFIQLLTLFLRREEILYGIGPSLWVFGRVLFVPYLIIAAVAALLFARILGPMSLDRQAFSWERILHALLYFLVPPVLFFVASLFSSGNSLFVPRYFVYYTLGLSLFYAMLCAAFRERRAVSLLFPVLALFLLVREAERQWEFEDWRSAVAMGVDIAKDSGIDTVLFYSGLVEAGNKTWLDDASKTEYLQAPLSYYPLQNQALTLPPIFKNPEAKIYLKNRVQSALDRKKNVLLLSLRQRLFQHGLEVTQIPKVYVEELKSEGFSVHEQWKFGQVELVLLGRE